MRAWLEMLVDDARHGNVKDPKKRNIKGRRDKLDVASRMEKPSDALEGGRSGRAQPVENDAASRQTRDPGEASHAIASAKGAVDDLKSFLSGRKSLVDLTTLV